MPRPKGEPTKVVRLPVRVIQPLEAEAKRTQRTLADVLTARLTSPVAALVAPVVARASREAKAAVKPIPKGGKG